MPTLSSSAAMRSARASRPLRTLRRPSISVGLAGSMPRATMCTVWSLPQEIEISTPSTKRKPSPRAVSRASGKPPSSS